MNGFSIKNLPKRNKLILLFSSLAVVILILVGILIAVYQDYLHQMEIVNVANYPSSLPSDMRDNLEVQLRRLLSLHFNAPDDAIIAGTVRDGTYRENTVGGLVTATFILDIDAYKQTYSVIMNWSDTIEVPDGVLISCPETRLMKYPDATCAAMYNDSQDVQNIANNPLYNVLPIVVDEFDYGKRQAIHYEIRGYFNEENQLVLVINDYSGGNYENALNRVRAAGYEPSNYPVEYYNRAGNY